MKKAVITWTLLAALMLSLCGCASQRPEANEMPVEPQAAEEFPAPAEDAAPAETAEPEAEIARADGEHFDAVIMLEGMEETVEYCHARNDTLGFEIDYEYDSLVRLIEADRERFVSVWDNDTDPENYLEVRYDTGNFELVTDAISATLSNDYEIVVETLELDKAGTCNRIDASEVKGGGFMPEHLQTVYIIPAGDGCFVATVHCTIESAEGFGHRIAYMMNTFNIIG